MKVTIYDVAKKANVSIATVSKVINNSGKISEATSQRVRAEMNELNYRSNLVASALTRKETKTIGLLIPDVANPYFSEVARRIEDWSRKREFGLTICNTDSDDEKTIEYIEILQQKEVDGLIISCTIRKKDKIQELLNKKLPLILFSTSISHLDLNTVTVDEYYCTYKAIEHLINQGCEKIAFIGEDISRNVNRSNAYHDALKHHGLTSCENWISYRNSSILGGKESASKILETGENIDGIFACNDMLAIGALKEVQKRG